MQTQRRIHIEACQNCPKHEWHTRHDENKYIDEYDYGNSFKMINPLTYMLVKREIENAFSECYVVEKNFDTPKPRMGAFEVTDTTDVNKKQVFNLLNKLSLTYSCRCRLYTPRYGQVSGGQDMRS